MRGLPLMRVLGINAIYHDPSAALVVDGHVVAAAEEERFSRRKHGKRPVPFSAWELPEQAMRWCLDHAGLSPRDVDAVAYGWDPALAKNAEDLGLDDPWDHLRTTYAEQVPGFLATALPGIDPSVVRYVPHHVAHAASAALASPFDESSVLVLDGRGERASHLAGHYSGGRLDVLSTQELPHSLGLLYESLTAHLGFLRSSDEYKVMALASYGRPRFLDDLRDLVYATDDGGFVAEVPDWDRWVPARVDDGTWGGEHADLACSVQARLEEVLVDLARWLHERTGDRALTMAGGIALNCVANSRIWRDSGFETMWVPPVAHLATALGTRSVPLFGPVSPAQWGPAVDPERHHVLWNGSRAVGDPHGDELDPALASISVDQVWSAVAAALTADEPGEEPAGEEPAGVRRAR
ncbi:carbamoyltransferase N-terminal domain-containing protein [Cellulomonas edaphi]|uniref:Carbamoyltransferase N-terminal domain-containing protein n=1 Tax=Cellulomonas edaphi TaxID=3053468 RepID=A0ABT7S7J8_9CELL|nr:carbamoyltransferase N-terminal domain-containing protein [Cellulomons edaphi]MDM7831605.1 carbamoyltransferase N-terminal domain-containing protein [Cellulomons edaphi]